MGLCLQCILASVIIVCLRGIFRQFLLLKPYWKQSKPDMVSADYIGLHHKKTGSESESERECRERER